MSGAAEPLVGALADFWHSPLHTLEPEYTAVKVLNFQCGDCGQISPLEGWPARCPQGHLNLKDSTTVIYVYQCGKCRVAISQERWPSTCARGHLNEKPGSV